MLRHKIKRLNDTAISIDAHTGQAQAPRSNIPTVYSITFCWKWIEPVQFEWLSHSIDTTAWCDNIPVRHFGRNAYFAEQPHTIPICTYGGPD